MVVLHARCTPKITHHLRRKRPNAGPNRIRKSPRRGLPYLAAVGQPRDRRQAAVPTLLDGNENSNAAVVGRVLGDSKPFDPTAPCGPLRACIPIVCPSHEKIDFDDLHRSPRSPEGVPVHDGGRISNRRYRLERAKCGSLVEARHP